MSPWVQIPHPPQTRGPRPVHMVGGLSAIPTLRRARSLSGCREAVAPRRSRAASRSPPGPASSRPSGSPRRPRRRGFMPCGLGTRGAAHVPPTGRLSQAHGARQLMSPALDAGLLRPEGASGGDSTVSARVSGPPGASSATNDRCGCSTRSCAAAPTAARAPTSRSTGRVGPVRIGRRSGPSGPWLITQTHTHSLTSGPECGQGRPAVWKPFSA